MKIKAVVIHRVPLDDGSGYWAEVPALPGCMTQGETYEELLQNLHEAVEGWLPVATERQMDDVGAEVVEIAASTASRAAQPS